MPLGFRIEGGEILFPGVVHGTEHRPYRELQQTEQQVPRERRSLWPTDWYVAA